MCCYQSGAQKYAKLLEGMRLVKVYEVGTQLFTAPGKQGRHLLPGIPWRVHVYHDPCEVLPAQRSVLSSIGPLKPMKLRSISHKPGLTFVFKGTADSKRCTVMMDSGSSDEFVTESFVKLHGLPVRSSVGSTCTLADGHTNLQILGKVTVTLKIQRLKTRVSAFVIPSVLKDVDTSQNFYKIG